MVCPLLSNYAEIRFGQEVDHHVYSSTRYRFRQVKLIPPQYVKPYVKGNKNDFIDADAIAEAAQPLHRQYWRIENSQHCVLDVLFKEDNSRITLEDAVENIALFRRVFKCET
jgi:hypothetical protein